MTAALEVDGRQLSAAELARASRALAERWAASGLRPGERLGLVTDSPAGVAAALQAARNLRHSLVLLAPELPPAERGRRLEATGCSALQHAARDSIQRLGARHQDPEPSAIVFTSGTTGSARPVVLPWSRLEQSAEEVTEAVALRSGDRWVSPLPLDHVGGLGVLLRCERAGACASLLSVFEPSLLAERLAAGATHASLVARMLQRLLDEAPGLPGGSSLRTVMVGGGRVPPELITRARRAGIPAVSTYGLTEAGSTVTLHRPDKELLAPGDAGWPLRDRELRLDPEGRIELRGGCMAAELDGPFIPGGWLTTGDFGRIEPDGRLVVLERRTDRIVTGGQNVSPLELERVLGACPGVAELCVVGLTDPDWGQRVVAVVSWKEGADEARLRALAEQQLAPWQRPRQLVAWEGPLPRNALGKILRARIREALQED